MLMKPLHAACAAAIVLAACGDETSPTAPAPSKTPVKIGFLVSPDRAYLNSAMMAVDEANADGGLLGRPVELVFDADLEEAAMAVEAAETMILEDEVVAIIGPNRSTHAVEVGPVAQRHSVPMVTTGASNPAVTAAGDLVFMAASTDRFNARVMAEFAFETLGVKTAAVIVQRGDVFSEGRGAFFAESFRQAGGTIVAEQSYERGTTDFTPQLTTIAAAAPAALLIVGLVVEEAALLTVQARALPLHDAGGGPTLFLGPGLWDRPALVENAADAVEGSFFTTQFSPYTDDPTARAFAETYRDRFGFTPGGGDAASYDAVRLFLQAADRAGSLEADAVRRELLATEQYVGATRISHYNADRHPTKSAVIMTIENGMTKFYRQVDP